MNSPLLVEDALAREIVLRAMRGAGGAQLPAVDVLPQPGGSTQLRNRSLPLFASEQRPGVLVYLDGDQRLDPPLSAAANLAPNDLRSEAIRLLGVHNLEGYVPANTGGITDDQMRALIAWAHAHVRYLPGEQPESWLRNQVIQEPRQSFDAASDAKVWWEQLTASALGKTDHESVTGSEILECQKVNLAKLDGNHADLLSIRTEIAALLERAS